METFVSLLYKNALRAWFFREDPETIHEKVLKTWGSVSRAAAGKFFLEAIAKYNDKRLETSAFGVNFTNPIGLAAGFDKNCAAPYLFDSLGFGFFELGTVTAKPQEGNPRPRIFRFPSDSALINRMGFPSEGADRFVERVSKLSAMRTGRIGINIGKTKAVPVDNAESDYLESFDKLKGYGDYFVLNVSSPNTPELRKLQEKGRLESLFKAVQEKNMGAKPVLVKIAPDLTDSELDDVIDVSLSSGISGLIATNTTIGREGLSVPTSETGGLSGKPVKPKSLRMVGRIHERVGNRVPIVGAGGIFTVSDVLEFLKAGACLVQVYTGFIYEGPDMVYRLKKGLVEEMEKRGASSIAELAAS